MLKKFFFKVLIALIGCGGSTAIAQTDSTDLDLYMTAVVLESGLDSMLFGDGTFEQLHLDFTVSDTVTFSKVHVELNETGTPHIIFKKSYSLSDLELEALITAWDVRIPFGNLSNTLSYQVAIIVENYDGSLGTSLIKTLNP